MTLTEFLTARLDEDETAARAATQVAWHVTHDPLGTHVENGDGKGRIAHRIGDDRLGPGHYSEPDAQHIARNDPARVQREVEAKRAIVNYVAVVESEIRNLEGTQAEPLARARMTVVDAALWHLATVYADHPDYREEWRP